MSDEYLDEIFDNPPFIAWIHNISKNQLKYLNSQIEELDLGHEIRFVLMIYDNPGISQDDVVNLSGQSKASIAKSLKKLENRGFIERKVNPENRRKYMLKTTSKADEIVPEVRKISRNWERKVGINEDDEELRKRIKEIAINAMKLVK